MHIKSQVLAICLLIIVSVFSPPANSAQTTEFMPVSSIKRDMTGYGLTVFQGTKVERFHFRVLGVVKKANTGRDLILIRASGGPIVARGAGIIAGMSGSPCYINGKLIGAVGYSFPYSKEPIGMVTPIADMVEALDDKLPKSMPGTLSASLSEPVKVGNRTYSSVSIAAPGSLPDVYSESTMSLVPLMTPVMVSGMSDRGVLRLQNALRPKGISVMSGPGGAAISKTTPKLVPGAAIGMSMATGDIDMTSIGTLTYIKGDKIVAFGHPMMGIGPVDAPMTGAYVHDVIASFRGSTKIASAMSTIGRFDQDRPWSVAGQVGGKSRTIPVVVKIDNKASGRKRTYNVKVINHPLMTPDLLSSIVMDSIYQMQPNPGDITARVDFDIDTDQLGKISRSNSFFEEQAIDTVASSDISNVFLLLSMNKYEPVEMKSVKVSVTLESKRGDAAIDRIFVKKDEFEPGETVDVGVVLRPYKRDRTSSTVQVKIPENIADGTATLLVRGGGVSEIVSSAASVASADAMSAVLGPDDLSNSDNAKQLLDKYLKRDRNNQIVAKLITKSNTISIEGKTLTGLPSIISDLMLSSRTSGSRSVRTESKAVSDCEYVVRGAASLPIVIKRKAHQELKAPAAAATTVAFAEDEFSIERPDNSYQYASADLLDMAATDTAKPADKNAKPAEKTAEPAKQPAPAAAKTETTETKPKPEAVAEAKSVVRPLSKWQINKQADFAKGKFDATTADNQNRIAMVPKIRKLCDLPEQFIWSTAAVSDGVIAGTGSNGRIYHIDKSGKSKVLYETGEVAVHALVVDSQGNIYASTSPSGKIFRITPDGTGAQFCALDAKHILALAMTTDGNLLAGAGDGGNIYKISSEGNPVVMAALPADSIYCLLTQKDGSILAGTGPQGVLYRVTSDGAVSVVYDSEAAAVTSVAVDNESRIYAGVSPKGDIYRIDIDGNSKMLLSATAQAMSMLTDKEGRVMIATGPSINIAWQNSAVGSVDCGTDKVQFICMASESTDGLLYAGTANPASIYAGPVSPKNAVYESPVYDTKSVSKWSTLRWNADLPAGSGIVFRTRTGATANPDSGWSAWSLPYDQAIGSRIYSPQARYIQFKAEMSGGSNTPTLSSSEITFLTANEPPKVKFSDVMLGTALSGSKDIKWTGTDPDKDTITYELYYSSDVGKSWHVLLGPGRESESSNVSVVDVAKIEQKVKTELEKSPDIPEDVKKSVLDKAALATTSAKTEALLPTATSYSWDTKKIPDGTYQLKLIASDKYSNADGALTDVVFSDSFIVCNTAPVFRLESKTYTVSPGVELVIRGSVSSSGATVAGVQYNRDSKTWIAAACGDGIYDSGDEKFTINIPDIKAGTYKIEIQALDSAGNSAKETVEVVCK